MFLSGCGYHLIGTRSNLPPHAKTLAIPILKNVSPEPEIHRDLTLVIRQAFISDGHLRVLSHNKADLLMEGTLNYYRVYPVAFSTSDVASEYWVELGVAVEVTDQVKKETYLKQNFRTKWDYRASPDVAETEAARLAALQKAYRELANRLVSMVIEQF